MHQTTIRFDSELWRRIDAESVRVGVSAAQYIRDAALIRLTQTGDAHVPGAADPKAEQLQQNAASAIAHAEAAHADSRAVWAQARQARERARSLRAASQRLAEGRASRRRAGGHVGEQSD